MAHRKERRLYELLLIILVGVLVFRSQEYMSNMNAVVAQLTQNPRVSEIALPEKLHTNLTLRYETYLSKYTEDTCTTTVPSIRYLARTSQNFTVTPASNTTVWIQEAITINWTSSTLANKIFAFTISNTSDIPSNKTGTFPSVLDSHWEHNYPSANETRDINNQEATYVLGTMIRSMILAYNISQTIILGDLVVPTERYDGMTAVNNYQEG
jgi:hypothetical protein